MDSLGIGLQLTIYGMGLVFLLLALMAVLLKFLLMSDSAKAEVPAGKEQPPPRATAPIDYDAMAAIIVAVTTHRALRRKEAAPVMREHLPGTIPSRWVTVGRSLENTSWHPGRRNQ